MSNALFDTHPKLTLGFFVLFLLLLLAGLSEIFLRFIVSYDIGYYTAVKKQGKYEYPYGTIYMNEAGYPDTAFDLGSSKKRIGYFGDSVVFGVGAGAGHRLSDLLEDRYPAFEHWTFGMISNGIQDDSILQKARAYNLNTVVYAFNLNDILPRTPHKNKGEGVSENGPFLFQTQRWIGTNLDGLLRGRSYLYTALRTVAKNILVRLGYSTTGFRAAEFFPSENLPLIQEVAGRINDMARSLKKEHIDFCVILLPYEMQISRDAEKTYAALGIKWEKGFEDGSTQDILKKDLNIKYIYDGRDAFTGLKDTIRTGDYFVYNKGDKIDFNHPNREGHALLTKGFIQSRSCPFLK
ncbi:MAG: hypothetical protein H6853_02605 [Rhodospirillales bacterium]|nr:hypothetical protein [Alphaproteobacteria bacterium]USO04181.1 MAG: hypothetical protein H6853_02605 [Rhodospirillales bacterium]